MNDFATIPATIFNGETVRYYPVPHNLYFELAKVVSQPPEPPGQARKVEIELNGKRFFVDYTRLEKVDYEI